MIYDDDVWYTFDASHTEALAELRKAIEKHDWQDAMAIFDRHFTESGEPK